MRQITSYSPFLDGNELLDGTLYVLEHGTTTQASVYDNAGVALSQPITITNGKPSTQVFVANKSVDCKVYVGTTLKHTWEDIFVKEDIAFDDIGCVDTIASLRTATASVGDSVVLLGYNAKGDKPSLVYTLVFNALLEDDGGLTIAGAVSGTYWVAKIEGVVDVRHYGIFPNNTASIPNIQRIKWYFPKVSALAYSYDIGSATLHNAQFDNGVRITANGEEQAYVYDSDVDNVTFAGYIKIVGNTLRTSILADSEAQLEARETIIIDSNNYNLTAHNVDIRVYQNFNKNITLTNCQIWNCGGKISSATQHIHNCLIKNDVLVMPANPDYSGNRTDVNIGSGDKLVEFCRLNGINDIDLQGGEVSVINDFTADITLRNGVLNACTNLNVLNTTTLENCTGSIASWKNCFACKFINCDIYGEEDPEAGYSDVISCKRIVAYDSVLETEVRCSSHSKFQRCDIKGNLHFYVDENNEQVDMVVESCVTGRVGFVDRLNLGYGDPPSYPASSSVYVDKIRVVNNSVFNTTDTSPYYVTNTSIYEGSLGSYEIYNNGKSVRETKIPEVGGFYRSLRADQVSYDNNKHVWLISNILSISALTFNFGETYNTNRYFKDDVYMRCHIAWEDTDHNSSEKTTDDSFFKLPSTLYSSGTSNIQLRWTKEYNGALGMDCSRQPNENCGTWRCIVTWGQFDTDDFTNCMPQHA